MTNGTVEGGGKRPGGRWVIWAGILAVLLVYWFTLRPRPSAVSWRSDYQTALQEARRTQRPVLLEFHTSWCSPCEWMGREVFPRSDVARALARWIPVQIDGDTNDALMRQFAVDAFPTFVALRPDASVVRQSVGMMTPEEFIAFVRDAEGGLTSMPASAH